jgi:tetratricopeptide (TPR) repeat protein/DNA-binding CsgD family transcriptional regulator
MKEMCTINRYKNQIYVSLFFFLSFLWLNSQNDTLLIKDKIDKAFVANTKDEALQLFQEAKDIALNQANPRWKVEPFIALGVYNYQNNEFSKALNNYNEGLALADQFALQGKKAKLSNYISTLYSRISNHQKGFEYALNALKIYQNSKDESGMAQAYKNMADELYADYNKNAGNFQKALQYYQLAIDIFKKQKDYSNWVSTLNNMAVLYMDAKKPEEGLQMLEKAKYILDEHKQTMSKEITEDLLADILCNKGWIYLLGLQKTNEAIGYIKTAILFCNTKPSHDHVQARNYLNLTVAYIKVKAFNLARQSCDSTIQKAIATQDIYTQAESYSNLYYLDSLDGSYALALEHQTRNYNLKDSINSNEKMLQLEALNIQYETEKRDLENIQLKQKATFRRNIIISLLLLLIVSIISLYFYFRTKKLENAILKQKAINLENENEALLLDKILEEEENKKLKEENEVQNRLLTANTISLEQNKNALQSVYENLNAIKRDVSQEDNALIMQLKSNIKSNLNFAEDWHNTSQHFEKMHPNFLTHLKNLNPNLTQNDLRHCAYIKLNLNTKEIATILNIDSKSVRINRYRVKKKLGLTEEQDLFDYISAIQ